MSIKREYDFPEVGEKDMYLLHHEEIESCLLYTSYMATAGGAYAMGLPDCDCLAVGKKADLVMIDLQPVSYTHLDVYKRQRLLF